MSNPTDVLIQDLRHAREAFEALLASNGGTVVLDEDDKPALTLRDAEATDTGVIGWPVE